MTQYPEITNVQFEIALRHFAGTRDGELFDVAIWCAAEYGISLLSGQDQTAYKWFSRQVDSHLDRAAIYEVPLSYVDYGDDVNSELTFMLLPSGAFGCWRFDSSGDTIAFVTDEFDPLTLPFHLKRTFLGAEGLQFLGPICLEPVQLRSFKFARGESYPINDPAFWLEVFNAEDMAREVDEAKRKW